MKYLAAHIEGRIHEYVNAVALDRTSAARITNSGLDLMSVAVGFFIAKGFSFSEAKLLGEAVVTGNFKDCHELRQKLADLKD